MNCIARRRQGGAAIVTVTLVLLFLMGFMGIAFDFGHLFVVRTELQTAMDSCALAAAQELDGTSTAQTRAVNAGVAAANMNRVNFQSASWDGMGRVSAADISFRDAAYAPAASPAASRYVQCQHTQSGVRMWLMHAMGAFSGDTTAYPNTRSVLASAVATRGHAQTACPVPLGLKPKGGGVAPNYGFQVGEWVQLLGSSVPGSGEIGWYNLDGSSSAAETNNELGEGGYCGVKVGDTLGTPGVKSSTDTVWNYRFGIYKNSDDPSVNHPDLSGYAYTATNWKNAVPQNAWSGSPAAGSHASAANFQLKRAAFASFDDDGTSLTSGSQIAFGQSNALNSFKKLATPGSTGQHAAHGFNRRLVVVPVLNGAAGVIDFVCMFMLEPLTGPNQDVHLEFLGNAAATTAPCAAGGLAGGTAGPLTAVLVR